MSQEKLIHAFELGDMGEVEFLELALKAGMDFDEIGEVLARVRSDEEAAV